ncbi:helix-turn-helix domain-containing protein [Blastococcus sp. TF02A-35]|uniref:helix-turn-helix domain-containing protein n=1 Tax=Blastococcus sp. TF02A-35 TaxID=2559612 RepID=UPI0010730308|nr:helix-turn-helix domain-containing protein [Blastococcus sp. TF02A_35]TFV49528.1 DNA-binding protein [Blastococcus sp. TF02A_35]
MNLTAACRSEAAALTVAQVAQILEVDVRTVSRACDEGQIPSLRVGRRLLIPRLPLLALLGAAPDMDEAGPASPAFATTNTHNSTGVTTNATAARPIHLAS